MPDDRLTLAIGRLERAMARVEAAGTALHHAAAECDSVRRELDRLGERHRRLRAGTADALEQLDGLMAGADHG